MLLIVAPRVIPARGDEDEAAALAEDLSAAGRDRVLNSQTHTVSWSLVVTATGPFLPH